MKIKKIFLLLLVIFTLGGCTKLQDLSYDDILNTLSIKPKNSTVYRRGYNFYVPNGLQVSSASLSSVILSSSNLNYYLYVDLISYNAKDDNFVYEKNNNALYSTSINYDNKKGYVEINLKENNQYLIEIIYNYAKIEVMVDEHDIKNALINAINILKSIKYDDIVIADILNDDNLDYTEEIFDMFDSVNDKSNVLDYDENDNSTSSGKDAIKDTDYVGR